MRNVRSAQVILNEHESMGLMEWIDAVEDFSPVSASSFRQMLTYDDLWALGIFIPQGALYGDSLQYVINRTKEQRERDQSFGIDVDGGNVERFVLYKCQELLMGDKRGKRMLAMRRGMAMLPDLMQQLDRLNVSELMVLINGSDYIDADMVLQQLVFVNEDTWNTPAFMKRLFRELLTENDLRRFLKWSTGLCSIPYGGFPAKLSIEKRHRTFAHTCQTLWYMEMQDFSDYEAFRMHFMEMLEASTLHADMHR